MPEADRTSAGDRQGARDHRAGAYLIWYGLGALLAAFVYLYGLGSAHIPKNGDEYPYEHITRLTAASRQWLPLQSALDGNRNTKPPLLFWQGIASTDWGRQWTLWDLRWPSVVYTLLTAVLVCLVGLTMTGRIHTGLLGLLIYLAFLSSYRYGRPFLTDPPSVFWLFVPIATLAIRPTLWRGGGIAPWLLGMATGVALLYKSFALVVPVALCLSWWLLARRHYQMQTFFRRDLAGLVVLAAVALSLFSLWFAIDPDPAAVVREFVLNENAAKFAAPDGYLRNLFWGTSSLWRILVSYPLDAGPLLFPLLATAIIAFNRRAQLGDGERLLWMWTITLLVVFTLPSQRDERYLLPGMPALAVLCAVNWPRIGAGTFRATLIVTGVAALLLAYLAWRLDVGAGGNLYAFPSWLPVITTVLVAGVSLAIPRLAPSTVPIAVLLAFLSFAVLTRPLDGAAGTYGAEAIRAASGHVVWVPTDFAAKEEGHRFLLPGADVRGYPYDPSLSTDALAARYTFFAQRLPLSAPAPPGLTIVGQRLDIASRQTPAQIADMMRGHVFEHLFLREWLLRVGGPVEPSPTGVQ